LSPRIFISYARKDGARFAADLREKLLRQQLSVWQDIIALEGGRDWWSQIEEAIRSKALEHIVLVVTPAGLESAVMRREIRLARQEGKTVSPIRGPGLVDLNKLPRWLGQLYDLNLPEHLNKLFGVLALPSRQNRVPMMAPEAPADFVERPVQFGALKQELLDAKGDAVAISTALKGGGGFGKTTLAKALAHDPDIQDAYFDGILWTVLGERPGNVLSSVSDLIVILTGDRPGVETIHSAAAKLGEALGDRRILLIVDDVWREQDLRPFLQGGPRTTRLITTRIDNVLPACTKRQPVDAMSDEEALKLLAWELPLDQTWGRSLDLSKLAKRLGEWPLLLKLVNGFLRDRVLKSRQALSEALVGVNKRLDNRGVVVFDARDPADRSKAVSDTVGASLELLDGDQCARFGELGIFPEDIDVPLGVVSRLWAETGSLDEFETEDLLVTLYGLSLLLSLDLDRRTFRLHDILRHFLRDQAGAEQLVAQNKRLLRATDNSGKPRVTDALSQRYFYLHLPDHLAAANERDRLDQLILDPGWLKAKLAATGSPQALINDYDRYSADEFQTFIGRTLRLSAGICARDHRQLIPQLLGRLIACEGVVAKHFLDMARHHLSRPAIVTERASLTPPGAETTRLEGHSHWVSALCALPDGRLASGSGDNTIRLWDLTTGTEAARLEGHSRSVNTLCALPDGRLASGSDDNTIRLWNLTTGAETARLEGHEHWVMALCALPDGRLASGSADKTIRVWDLTTGAETARLQGHSNWVWALCVLPDGRLASGSKDGTIRLWDLTTGVEAARLQGHSGSVIALCALPDGRLASSGSDRTIRLWDLTTGAETARLQGHSDWVKALGVLPDGRLASSSDDNTIRLWDLTTSAETARLEGHSNSVWTLCALPDGRLASGSGDNTIRLWDPTTGAKTARLEGHSKKVDALCVLPDGRLASGSGDNTIRLWDLTTSASTARLEGHSKKVNALCVLPDGRLASGSADRTIRLWTPETGAESARLAGREHWVTALCALPDGRLASGYNDSTVRLWNLTTGAETARLEGHEHWVMALCALPDGRLASGSADKTIRLWDLRTGAEIARVEDHSNWVMALCALPDGRLASASADSTIRLWNLTTGAETARLEGHSGRVRALCVLPDGRLVSGSDDHTIRLWDLTTGAEIARLEIDAPVRCLITLSNIRFVAGDALGRLHWLEVAN
jgi:WD40 repeat protein